MLKILIFIFIIVIGSDADENVLKFYQATLQNLKYSETYTLYKNANTLEQKAAGINRFANFSVDGGYTVTKADRLTNRFNTTDISINDTIDLFGKNSYKINKIALDLKARESALKIQKEKLFTSLIDMIGAYWQTKEQLSLHVKLLDEQQSVFDKLQKLNASGAVSKMDIIRFKTTLTLLKTQIIDEKQEVAKMDKQLNLYASKETVPTLKDESLACTKEDFLLQDPNVILNDITARQLTEQSRSLSHGYLPVLVAGTSYQKIDDPTANGDNYSFNISFHMPINGGDFKQSEALKAQSLSVKSQDIEYKIQRENEYTARVKNIDSADKQLTALKESLDDSLSSQEVIKKAFLKQYVDFNTYLQVLDQALSIQEQIIKTRYQKYTQTVILNNIGSGAIYE